MKEILYKQHFVWRRLSNKGAKRYCCFENLETGFFFVQSADFFWPPFDAEVARQHEKQVAELFIEIDDKEFRAVHASLKSAIEEFEYEFSN